MATFYGPADISKSDEYLHEIIGFIRVHKDGKCERFLGNDRLPAGLDSSTGVQSKDVMISPETNVFARLYIPKTATQGQKLPVLIYIHGGGFVFESTTSVHYHSMLNLFTKELNVIIVSIEYRLGPEHPVPAAYNDSWEGIQWVASHSTGTGPDPWLNEIADFNKVFFAGDSSGANIAHNMGLWFGINPIVGITLAGIILLAPYFGGKDPIGSELGVHKKVKVFTDQFWNLANPSRSGLDDPLFNPEKDPNLSSMGCSRIFLAVSEKDSFRDRGLHYKDLMEKSGWNGKLDIMDTKEQDHNFFLFDLVCSSTGTLCNRMCTFINHQYRF
ncbi:putative carboxylesterase 2 [Bidens hawaiensis]|uniref:putative carboxylesterase 2 n=1 Tax=Bidens hawaiensis TaxID=980011 RepID=UPI00404AA18A